MFASYREGRKYENDNMYNLQNNVYEDFSQDLIANYREGRRYDNDNMYSLLNNNIEYFNTDEKFQYQHNSQSEEDNHQSHSKGYGVNTPNPTSHSNGNINDARYGNSNCERLTSDQIYHKGKLAGEDPDNKKLRIFPSREGCMQYQSRKHS